MSFDWSFRDYFNLSKKIPLHYQKRYLANYNNGSFNASMLAGIYKKRIKKLSENNRMLAAALQNDRIQKEELLSENRANADLVLFSRLKLTTMSESLKKMITALDEALGLLEMHSSKTISKLTPKNTVSREEFKEQIRNNLMTAISEEIELPEVLPEERQIANDLTQKETKDAVLHSSCAKRKSSKQNSTKMEQKSFENKFTSENSKQIKISDEMVSPVKKFDRKTKKKNIYNRKRTKKTEPQVTDNSKEENFKENIIRTDTPQLNNLEEEKVSSEESNDLNSSTKKTVQLLCDSLNFNSAEKQICEGIEQGQQKNSNREISSKPVKKIMKKISELPEAVNNSNIEESLLSESLKNSNEKLLFHTEKENSLSKNFKKPITKKTALKNISSKINIENMQIEKMKRKSVFSLEDITLTPVDEKEIKKRKSTIPLDDLTCSVIRDIDIVQKKKSNKLYLKNNKKSVSRKKVLNENLSSASDIDKLSPDSVFPSDVVLCKKEEMVKSLAENTFLVTAEVHKSPSNISEIHPKTNALQPVVLLNDVFKASKSLCKNISSLPFDQTSEKSLEKQLLQRCSSLKIIAENSLNTLNQRSINTDSGVGKSVDQSENSSKTISHIEPPLLEDGKVDLKQMNEDKKPLRKKGTTVCYKEPSLHIKMRRGKY